MTHVARPDLLTHLTQCQLCYKLSQELTCRRWWRCSVTDFQSSRCRCLGTPPPSYVWTTVALRACFLLAPSGNPLEQLARTQSNQPRATKPDPPCAETRLVPRKLVVPSANCVYVAWPLLSDVDVRRRSPLNVLPRVADRLLKMVSAFNKPAHLHAVRKVR